MDIAAQELSTLLEPDAEFFLRPCANFDNAIQLSQAISLKRIADILSRDIPDVSTLEKTLDKLR